MSGAIVFMFKLIESKSAAHLLEIQKLHGVEIENLKQSNEELKVAVQDCQVDRDAIRETAEDLRLDLAKVETRLAFLESQDA